jgi:hypothetical protein
VVEKAAAVLGAAAPLDSAAGGCEEHGRPGTQAALRACGRPVSTNGCSAERKASDYRLGGGRRQRLILHEKGDAIVLRVPPIAAEGKSLVISLLNLPFSVLPLYLSLDF